MPYIKNDDLLKNTITNVVERVLWVDTSSKTCYCIEIMTKKMNIVNRRLEDIDKGFEEGIYTVLSEDIFYKILDENKLTPSRKERRDKRFEIVSIISNDNTIPDCFERNHRGKLVKVAMEICNTPEKTVYQHLRKFWQMGSTIDALSDDYDNCGKSENKQYTKKPGRKSEASKLLKDYRGVIVDEKVRKQFDEGINRYYKNNPLMSLAETFRYIIIDNYYNKPWNEKPTYDQFYYWYKSETNKDEIEKERKGKKNYQNNIRPLKSDSIYEANGPGFRYQVDSTPFPIQLVNRIDRDLRVGRPTVFFAVDVFTTKIVGVYIGLHGDSWEGYASLLYNAFTGMPEYCEMFGVNCSNVWSDKGSPSVILGDRGGFISKHSDILIKNLKIGFEFAPTFTGSAKGTVEKKFDIIERMIKHDLPGVILSKCKERGQRDPKKDAKLDIKQFAKIVLDAVLERNARIAKDYPLEKEAIWGKTQPSANAVWNWGMDAKKGALRSQPEDRLRFYLLRHARASTTERGIKYKNMIYTCDLAEKKNWFSRLNKAQIIEIAFDSRCMNTILMYDESTKRYVECHLNEKLTSNNKYFDRSLEEIEQYDKNERKKQKSEYSDTNDKLHAETRRKRLDTVAEANEQSEGNEKGRIEGTEENRSIENAIFGETQALIRNPYKNADCIETLNPNSSENKAESDDKPDIELNSSRRTVSSFINNKIKGFMNK